MNDKQEHQTFEEWLEKGKQHTNDNMVRAIAFYDAAPNMEKGLWTWIRDAFAELNNLYSGLEALYNWQKEEHENMVSIKKCFRSR